jgi:hypothetical protein
VYALVDRGAVGLNDLIFQCTAGVRGVLAFIAFDTSSCAPKVAISDARLLNITVQHLVSHAAGWDSGIVGDPMLDHSWLSRAEAALGLSPYSSTCANIVSYMLTQPLQHIPGTTVAYSNLGYCVLGLVIERAYAKITKNAAVTYGDAVKALMIHPAGIADSDMYLGDDVPRPSEDVAICGSECSPDGSWPGLFSPGTMARIASAGGWVATASAWLTLVSRIEATRCKATCLLSKTSMVAMSQSRFLLNAGDLRWSPGSLPGINAVLVSLRDDALYSGVAWTIVLSGPRHYELHSMATMISDAVACLPKSSWLSLSAASPTVKPTQVSTTTKPPARTPARAGRL